jgi:hypothetical protein
MTLLANQTVQDFFRQANWQGLKLSTDDENFVSYPIEEEIFINPDLSFTVEQFFSFNNWQGLSIQKTDHPQGITEQISGNTQVYQGVHSLTMTVNEFFQGVSWKEQVQPKYKEIAASPDTSEQKNSFAEPKQQFNVQDLSDLI